MFSDIYVLWYDKSIHTGIVNRILEPIPSAILKSHATLVFFNIITMIYIHEISVGNKRF